MNREFLEKLSEKALHLTYADVTGKEVAEGAEAKTLVDEIMQSQDTVVISKKDLQKVVEAQTETMSAELAETKTALSVMQKKIEMGVGSGTKKEQMKEKSIEFVGAAFKALKEKENLSELNAKALEDGIFTKAPTGTIDANGGFLVPELLHTEVKRAYQNYGFVEALFEHLPMASDSLGLPNTFNEAIVSMVGEKATGAASDFIIAKPVLLAKKATAKYSIPNELFEDNQTALDVGTMAIEKMVAAFEKNRENQMIDGDGTGNNHLGIFQDPAITLEHILGDSATSGLVAYSDINFDDLLKLTHTLLPIFRRRAVFMMNETVFDGLSLLKGTDGHYFSDRPFMFRLATPEQREKGFLGFIWNYPVYSTDFAPDTSDVSQAGEKFVAFANPFFLGAFGVKRQRTIKRLEEATLDGVNLAETDQTGYVGFERFAWLVAIPAACTFLVTADS